MARTTLLSVFGGFRVSLRFVIVGSLFAWSVLAQDAIYRIDARYIKVPVTVLDSSGKALLGLSKEDFILHDEGEPRPIHNFVLDTSPVHVVFLLDASGSVKEEIDEIKYATIRFSQSFDRDDRISILAFSDEVETLQGWTNDIGDLKDAVDDLQQGYRTALYDALWIAAEEKLAKVEGKRVIILLSDGLDNESEKSYGSVRNALARHDVILYIVSRTRLIQSKVAESDRVEFLDRVMKNLLGDEQSFVDVYFREKETSMNYLAKINGGRVLYPQVLQALGTAYVQIAEELKTQYLLTFLPPSHSEKEFRRIEVTSTQHLENLYHRELYRFPR